MSNKDEVCEIIIPHRDEVRLSWDDYGNLVISRETGDYQDDECVTINYDDVRHVAAAMVAFIEKHSQPDDEGA